MLAQAEAAKKVATATAAGGEDDEDMGSRETLMNADDGSDGDGSD